MKVKDRHCCQAVPFYYVKFLKNLKVLNLSAFLKKTIFSWFFHYTIKTKESGGKAGIFFCQWANKT